MPAMARCRLDIAGEATLLFGGVGDGIQSVPDFGDRAVGCLQDVWIPKPPPTGWFGEVGQPSSILRRTATDWALRLAVMASISLAEREDFRPACDLRRQPPQTAPLLAGAGSLDGGVQGQQVGLLGDILTSRVIWVMTRCFARNC